MNKTVLAIMSMLAMAAIQPAWAGGNHAHMEHGDGHAHSPQGSEHQHSAGKMGGMFLVKKEIDGYPVTFHVMKAPRAQTQGGSHHFMIKVEKDGKPLDDLVVNSKVIHPNGKSESKLMMRMGDWYMAAYDLEHEGRHQLMVLFKTLDGNKHFGGVYYPAGATEHTHGGDSHEHQH